MQFQLIPTSYAEHGKINSFTEDLNIYKEGYQKKISRLGYRLPLSMTAL